MNLLLITIICIISVVKESSQQSEIDIQDNCGPSTNVLDLNALMNPHPSQYKMRYTLSKVYKIHEYFEIKSDKVFTKTTIDLDNLCSEIDECCDKSIDFCNLKFVIISHANTVVQKTIQVHIRDVNDHSPEFERPFFTFEVSEGKKDSEMILLPLADDKDFGRNRIQRYLIVRKEPLVFDDYFSLVVSKDQPVPTQVALRLSKMIDRETISRFSFELLAIDGDSQMARTGSTSINIKITDVNDNAPSFEKNLYRQIVREGLINNLPIVTLLATDPDEGDNARVLYTLSHKYVSDNSINDQFTIDLNGNIFLKKPLDFERKPRYRFTVIASNPTAIISTRQSSSTATVEVEVENVNDEQLQIIIDYPDGKNWSIVSENQNDVFIAVVTTKSNEADRKNFAIVCKLRSFQHLFELIPKHNEDPSTKSFEIRTVTGIDRETNPRIDTNVHCSESNINNGKYSEAPLIVKVTDENDNSPKLKIDGRQSVTENEQKGNVIFTVKAQDPDEGDNGTISFNLDKSNQVSLEYLEIGERDGRVRVKNPIDCESTYVPLTVLPLIVTATDHGKPPRSTDLKLLIEVKDVNDNSPKFSNTPLQFSIPENSKPYSYVGDIEVTDRDYSDKVTLRIMNNNQLLVPFIITTKDYKIFSINTTRSLDREKDAMFKFDVVAVDGTVKFSHSVRETVEIKVVDVNDNSPTIIFPTQNNSSFHRLSYKEPINHKLLLVSANDLDQSPDNNRLEYSIEGDDSKIFGINNDEKFIVTQREMTRNDLGEHRIRIIVKDCGSPRLEASVTINVVIDQSVPKEIPSPSNPRYHQPNGDRASDGILSVNSDIILYVVVIVILFVIVIVIVVFIFVIRRCRTDNNCLYCLSMCCHGTRPSPAMSKSMISGPTSKSMGKDDRQIYNNHQATLMNNEKVLDERTVENWNSDVNQVQSYNFATNPYLTSKGAYTQLPNHVPCYYPIQYPNIYQTIEESQLAQKNNELTMKRMTSIQSNAMSDDHYKSELNLKKWNLSSGDSSEFFSTDNVPGFMLVTSQTPMPTRARAITNTVLDSSSVDENFAVAFPQDQSTFV